VNTHPPRPNFALSVGVFGHRPNRLPAQRQPEILACIREVLRLIAESAEIALRRHEAFFASKPMELTLISALAEGADRMAAEAALEQHLRLTAVLPFDVDIYQADFDDELSRSTYRKLLNRAEKVLVLCGDRAEEARAYETAGLTIVDNADILLAVWDGNPSAGRGGTTELLEAAARSGIPIIHVDAKATRKPCILWGGLTKFPLPGSDIADLPPLPLAESLPEVIDKIVRPPAAGKRAARRNKIVASVLGLFTKPDAQDGEREKLERFLADRWRAWNPRLEVPALLGLLGLRRPKKSDFRPRSPDVLSMDFAQFASSGGEALDRRERGAIAVAAEAYAWADALGVRYAQIFRGAYISNFVLIALLTLVSILSWTGTYIHSWPDSPFMLVQGVLWALIIGNTLAGRIYDWQTRWIETREVAERLRAGLPIWLLGQRPIDTSGEEQTWTGWYVRANFRAMGILPGTLDPVRLSAIKTALVDFVDDQCRYHAANACLMGGVERRLTVMAYTALTITFAFTIIPLISWTIGETAWLQRWKGLQLFVTAGLPAVTAAIYGIDVVGDFDGRAKRSGRSSALLSNIGQALKEDALTLANLRTRTLAIEETMLNNTEKWRLISQLRPLEMPN